jgi:hypothetical protein
MIALIQSEFSQRYSHRNFPIFVNLVESVPQLSNEVKKVILIAVAPTSVRRTWVLPVQIETVEFVFL